MFINAAFKPTPPRGYNVFAQQFHILFDTEDGAVHDLIGVYSIYPLSEPSFCFRWRCTCRLPFRWRKKTFEPFHPEIQAVFIFFIGHQKAAALIESIQRRNSFRNRYGIFFKFFSFLASSSNTSDTSRAEKRSRTGGHGQEASPVLMARYAYFNACMLAQQTRRAIPLRWGSSPAISHAPSHRAKALPGRAKKYRRKAGRCFEFRRVVSAGFYGFCGDLGVGMGYFTVFGKCVIAVGDTIIA